MRTAVEAGVRRDVHLPLGDRGGARCGHAHRGTRRGARACARHLPRARGRAGRSRARRRRSSISRASGSRDRSLGARRAARASSAAGARSCSRPSAGTLPVDVVGRWSELPTEREIDVGDARGACSRSAAARRSTRRSASPPRRDCRSSPFRRRTPARSGRAYFGVRDADRRMRGGGGGAHNEAIVYDVELTLGMPRERDRRHGAERARARVRGAVREGPRSRGGSARARRRRAAISDALPRVLDDARRPCRTRGAAARRRQGRRGARAFRARARARDGAGDRRPLRAAARRAQRDLPAARAAVQRRSSCPSELLGGRAAERARGARAPRRLHDAARARRARSRTCPSSPPRSPAARVRRPIRARRRPATCSQLLRRSSSDRESVIHPMSAASAPRRQSTHGGKDEPRRAGRPLGPPLTGRRRRSAGSRSPSSRVVLGSAVGTVRAHGRRVRVGPGGDGASRCSSRPGFNDAGDRERARPVATTMIYEQLLPTSPSRTSSRRSRRSRTSRTSSRRSATRTPA